MNILGLYAYSLRDDAKIIRHAPLLVISMYKLSLQYDRVW